MRLAAVLAVQAGAFAPVWRWYAARLTDGSDEPCGVLALATALAFVATRGHGGERWGANRFARALALAGAAALAYAALAARLTGLPRAALALAAVAPVLCAGVRHGRAGLCGLLALSLPIVASLQFFAGWPVRLVTARLAAGALTAAGWPVAAAGTCLAWRGDLIAVDAPCAGVKMLWSGLYLNCALGAFGGLDLRRTLAGWSATTACVFAGNLVRTVLLFFVESRLVPLPAGGHAGVGLSVFALVALAIVRVHGRLRRRPTCVR